MKCIKLKHPALVNRKGLILLHDNAQLHIAKPILQKLNELGYETLPHPPYSPDLSPTDYHFFKHLDNFVWEMLQKPKRYQKCLQGLHRHQNARFLRYWHKYTCFALAKQVYWVWRYLFQSINFCFEPKYVHLNLKVKNRKNFLVNLIKCILI